jgi:hypothetical protein
LYNYIELVQDDIRNRGIIVPLNTVPSSHKEVYRSLYLFTEDYKIFSEKNKSVSGYDGIVSIDNIPFDFDGEDLGQILGICRKFVSYLTSYGIDGRGLKYFYSGAKGFHIYLPSQVVNPKPSTTLPDEIKSLVKQINNGFPDYNVDLSIYDKTRVFRVVNTINAKTGRYKIPLTYYEFMNLSIDEIIKLAEQPRDITMLNTKLEPNKKLIELMTLQRDDKKVPEVKEYINIPRGKLCYANILQGVKEGSRDNCALRLATHLRKEGMPYETTLSAMLKWNEKNQPPMLDTDIERKTLSAYNVDYDFGCNDEILQQFCSENCILKKKKEEYNPKNKTLEGNILSYLSKVSSASRTSIELAVVGNRLSGEEKITFDSLMTDLVDQDKITKVNQYEYQIAKKMDWVDSAFTEGISIDFEMPYFNEYSKFNWGDLIILGSQNKYGKTITAMNIVKRLINQGIKPYYIYSETGGGFEDAAAKLKINPRQFYRTFCSNPYNMILEKNSVVIFDWVRPNDFARTDELFDGMINKLYKSKAILTCFVQLKTEGEQADQFFAPNLIGQYPSLLARYLHNEESDNGTKTYFDVKLIRRPKFQNRQATIVTRFNWETYEVKTLKELENENTI